MSKNNSLKGYVIQNQCSFLAKINYSCISRRLQIAATILPNVYQMKLGKWRMVGTDEVEKDTD
jgi:hypothetical protein